MCLQKLAEIKGLSDAKVEKLLDAARKLCSNYGWQTAKTMEIQVSSLYFTTAWPACDCKNCINFQNRSHMVSKACTMPQSKNAVSTVPALSAIQKQIF